MDLLTVSEPTTAENAGPTQAQPPLPCSVVIPTYNPRPHVFRAVLDALRGQTLPLTDWELIVVDNGSRPAVKTLVDLSWHPAARCVREERPGNHHARARALRESRGELVVNVDDDNALDPDYLERALRIAREWPHLGVWGGRIHAEFETPPPDWLMAHGHHLAICHLERPVWSSFVDDRVMPYGAGMCVRRPVVLAYLERFDTGDFHQLGRREGGGFVAGEDQVIAYTASGLGLAIGRFPQLEMRHHISPRRYDPKYLAKLVRGNAHGALLVQILHGNASYRRTHQTWPLVKLLAGLLFRRGMSRRLYWAEALGELDALRELRRAAKKTTATATTAATTVAIRNEPAPDAAGGDPLEPAGVGVAAPVPGR